MLELIILFLVVALMLIFLTPLSEKFVRYLVDRISPKCTSVHAQRFNTIIGRISSLSEVGYCTIGKRLKEFTEGERKSILRGIKEITEEVMGD